MRKVGLGLSGAAIMSLALAGCAIEPVDFIEPAPAPPGCDAIITRDARLPFPDEGVQAVPAANIVGESAGESETPPPAADIKPEPGGAAFEMLRTMLQTPETPAAGVIKDGGIGESLPPPSAEEPISPSVLVLSGGSQQGAFGAGFIKQWADARTAQGKAGLPRFRMVTGISTGSLQSTFAFLDRPGLLLDEYMIESEDQLLDVLVNGKLDDKPFAAASSLARKGTLSRLTPLRTRLKELITPEVLRDVAAEAAQGRSLLVGAVEMDTGEAAIFDLTKAARLYVGVPEGDAMLPASAPMPFMRDCYVEALMASSSVPMQADPVFIAGRMYIDGGARFGVLVDLTAEALHAAAASSVEAVPAPRNLYLLVNATLEVPELCSLRKCEASVGVDGAPAPERPPHADWNFVQLAQRSVSVMINQAYRSSVFIAGGQYTEQEFTTRFVRLDPEHLNHPAAITFGGTTLPAKTCRQWRSADEAADAPLEFFPRYMHCLASYGAQDPKLGGFIGAE
jgi:hypothetical protein